MKRSTLGFFSAATFALLSTSALSATKIGVVSAADASVSIIGEDGKERSVKLGDSIFANDTIKTDAKGKAQLMFEDRSTVTINENSDLKIDHFIYNPVTDTGEMGMKTVKGAFRFIGGALSKSHPVTIKTPVATIGIRGGIVDTHVEPDGKTDAVFVYGKELTMTNAGGSQLSTTRYGTGLVLEHANATIQPLPAGIVQSRLNDFNHTISAGGGVPATPDAQTIAPQLHLDTQSKAPEPQATDALTSNAPSQSAPIIFVEGNEISALDVAALTSDLATEKKDGDTQAASSTPEQLRELVDVTNLQAQSANNDALKAFLGETPKTSPVPSNTTPSPKPTNPLLPVANTLPLNPQTAPKPASLSTLGSGGGGVAASETFTAVTGRTGRFMVLSDTDSDGVIDLANRGDVSINEESPTRYRVAFTSNLATPLPSRTITLPKVTTAGLTDATASITESGVTSARQMQVYNTQGGAMQAYHLKDTGAALSDPSKEINFVVGSNIFDSSGTFANAAARSLADANAGTSHGTATNGVLLYDFLPEIGHGNGTQFGNFNYNRANGITDSSATPSQTEFGTAIDWNGGKQGNLFSGQVNWLAVGGKSSATGTFGRAHATPNAGNDFNIAGKRLAYVAEPVGSPTSGAGSIKGAAFAIDNNIFGRNTGAVEGAVVNYVTPNTNTNIGSTPLSQFGLPNANIANRGAQAIALKGNISGDLATQVAAPTSVNTQTGFASGIMMMSNGATFTPTVFSNNAHTDVTFTPTSAGEVSGFIAVQDFATNGAGGGDNSTTTSFSNPANSVYINNKLYAAQSGATSHNNPSTPSAGSTTGLNAAQSFIVSGGAVNNAKSTIPAAYQCNDCHFVNWGVWSGNVGNRTGSNANDDYANMIPYVVGEVTQNASSLSAHTANYKGEAYATVVKSGINPQNIAGTVDATVNYPGSGAPQLNTLNLNFGNVQGADLNMRNTAAATVAGSADAVFATPLESSGGTPSHIAGQAHGALYGATGQEIGGNYTFNRTTDSLQGGGIYLGKQRP